LLNGVEMAGARDARMTTDARSNRRSVRRRLAIIALLGVLVVAVAALYVQFWFARPIGSGPAGPAVDRKTFEKLWTPVSSAWW
jgi:hypothetical protein